MKTRHFHFFSLAIFLLITTIFIVGLGNIDYFMSLVYSKTEIADKDLLPKIGTFGDSAGLLNALFSSLAFGGVILTIIWQVSENSRQRKEEHRIQFENVFFNMTGSLEKIVSELKVEDIKDTNNSIPNTQLWDMKEEDTDSQEVNDDSPQYITGRAVFKYLYEDAPEPLEDIIKKEGILGFETAMYGMLDNYFRYLYRVLKYIDESTLIEKKEKYRYVGILRAQLSYMELIMVYYNCLSEYGNEKFKPLVEKYHLLKNIREDRLHSSKFNGRVIGIAQIDMYDESAWRLDTNDKMKENEITNFCWKIVFAFLFALIFNTLFSEWWYEHVVCLWKGMKEIVVRGLALFAFTLSLLFYCYRKRKYHEMFMAVETNKSNSWIAFRVLKSNYSVPIFLFFLLTSEYVNFTHHIVWFESHTICLNFTFFYCPLMADVIAMIWEVVNIRERRNNI